jgi:hypothetical protein
MPETGQTVDFVLPPAKEWQDVNVTVPIQGPSGIIRIFLPADKAPVEIESIRFFAGETDQPVHAWSFNRGR